MLLHALFAALAGYLIGSIPFGWLVARAKGVDIFQIGSGNIGATNVGRVLGKPFGYVVFCFDVVKGALPTAAALWWSDGNETIGIAAGLCAVLGHMFSVYLRFRGGKGVATATGVMGVLFPVPTVLALIAFVAVILGGQIMSLAAIVAAVVFAFARLSLVPDFSDMGTVFALFAAVLIIWAHRSNLGRLRRGEERVLASMERLSRLAPALHSLAVGIWLGAGVFFSLGTAPLVFSTFNQAANAPPAWWKFADAPDDLGNRLAGLAVGPAFPRYFLLQAVCGLLAAGTAFGWAVAAPGRLTRLRALLLVSAMVLVAIGWPVTRHVSALREARYSDEPKTSAAAREAFGPWHAASLLINLATLALVAPGLALAGYPPGAKRKTDVSP